MTGTHGKASTYRSVPGRNCRCEECRTANTERARAERASRTARLAADPGLIPHGTASTYNNWGCRCDPCSVAHAQRCLIYRQTHSRR